jgi:GNAT superfamily N-acetyltransferase
MTAADIDPAVTAILADDWGDRRSWFEFAVASPGCEVFVADDRDGGIAGTGVVTINGPVAWIGTVWVAPAHRGRGLGRALTQAAIEAAEAAGCRTLVLVATERGRPLYEQLGFEVQTWYRTMEAPGLARDAIPPDPRIRSFRAGDLPAMGRLDRTATGEDRSRQLAMLSTPAATQVLVDDAGEARAFLIRAPWGGGATVAPWLDDAMVLLHARRLSYAPERRVRCGVLLENEPGAAALDAAGWTEAWRAPRLIRGAPLDWHPEHLWGQFNHAMG